MPYSSVSSPNFTQIDPNKLGTNETPASDIKPQKAGIGKYFLPFSMSVFVLSIAGFAAVTAGQYLLSYSNNTRASFDKKFDKYTPKSKAFMDLVTVPNKINNTYIDGAAIIKQAKAKYKDLSEKEVIILANKELIGWLALKNYFGVEVPSSLTKPINDFAMIEKELDISQEEYDKNVIKLNGFFLKVRFAGTNKENLAKLGKSEPELKDIAKQKIQEYLDKAKGEKDPSKVVDEINNDDTVMTMNNGEKSSMFTDYDLFPPIFDDPNFDQILLSLPQNELSQIITLTTTNPGIKDPQQYAYAVFYITSKTGSFFPLEVLTDDYISKAKFQ